MPVHAGERCHWQAQFSYRGHSVYGYKELLHFLLLLSIDGILRIAGVHSILALLDIQDPAVLVYASNRQLNMQG